MKIKIVFKANILIIRNKVGVYIIIQQEQNMKDNIIMEKNMEMVYIIIQMVQFLQENISKEKSMEKAKNSILMELIKFNNGLMVNS